MAVIVVDAAGGGDAVTIQAGIGLAADGDVVEVAPGVYVEDVDLAGKTITVEGRGGSAVTSIVGTGAGSAVRVDSGEGAGTALRGFTISGGDATGSVDTDGSGGGLYVAGVPVVLDDLVLTGNAAEYGGGLMLNRVEGAEISNLQIYDNAAISGGDLYVYGGSAAIRDAEIASGAAGSAGVDGYGGGSVFYSASVVAERVVWSGNTATKYGGGHYGYGGDLSCTGCEFLTNSAESGGGAFWNGAQLTLAEVYATQNTAVQNGGGLQIQDSTTAAERLHVEGNAASYGAGLLLGGGSLSGGAMRFQDNTAAGGGGGVYNDGGAFDAWNSLFVGNVAGGANGGGIGLDGAQLTLSACVFYGNEAYSGGAIHVNGGSTATLTNLTLVENSGAASAGGVRAPAGATVGLYNTVIAHSVAGSGVSGDPAAVLSVAYNDLYGNAGGPTSGGLADPTGSNGNIAVDPVFLDFTADGTYDDDLCPAPGSPLIDAGDPLVLDADGSVSDIGACGGSRGAGWDLDWDGVTTGAGDCDDRDAAIRPGAAEICNGYDEDCDAQVDEGCGGDTGDTGDTGDSGDTGDTGPVDDTGPADDTGPVDDTGPADDTAANTDDTGPADDTGLPGDSGTVDTSIPGDTSGADPKGEGCACSSPGRPAAWLPLLGLILVVRRGRQERR